MAYIRYLLFKVHPTMTPFIILAAIVITLLAAFVEAHAYNYSFDAFKQGNIQWMLLALSFGVYSIGILIDYVSLYVLSKTSIFIPELLAAIFMVATLVGIALLSGQFLTWKTSDQIVAGLIVAGLGWLAFRVGD